MSDPQDVGHGPPGAPWIVLTPSVDDRAWRMEISRAAAEAGTVMVDAADETNSPPDAVRVTNDAHIALAAGATRIIALIPEPATAPEAIGDLTGMATPDRERHASMLLSRAAALASRYSVVSAKDLAARPTALTVLGALRLVPPPSKVEVSRQPSITAAFDAYAVIGPGSDQPTVWAQDLFTYDQRSMQDAPGPAGVLDTTGRPRMMVSGPYLYLPPGNWRACLRFGVDAAAAKHQFRLDWGTRTACVSEYVVPGAPGRYELELDFIWSEVDVAEIRIILMEGSFSGTVLFEGITVRQIEMPS
ncbi:hypothetical protein [Brevundimonas sp.]|uniref:hypothetical protein n=1 Tax=Brevundimonas sp. TaxID=1871086 RepID=UPI001A1FF19A|nr:hypothetical protein [Brevundimonas sp.]MBJ7485253.1 hypothetical protein [Brevundimonas sp.]